MEIQKKGLVSKIVMGVAITLFVVWMAYLGYKDVEKKPKPVSIDLEEVARSYPEHARLIAEIKEFEARLAEKPNNLELYADLGLAWKSLAEQIQEPLFFVKAREVYDRAIELTDAKNSLYTLNAADVSEIIKEFDEAERYYKLALQYTPADPDVYLRLATLYRQRLNKAPEEVLAVYDQGIDTIVFSGRIVLEKAEYLAEIERYEEALALYRAYARGVPDDQNIKTIIAELEKYVK